MREEKERERTKREEEGINPISLQIALCQGSCMPACNTVATQLQLKPTHTYQ